LEKSVDVVIGLVVIYEQQSAAKVTKDLIASAAVLGLQDGDNIGQHSLGSDNSLGVVGKHDRHLDSEHTLGHEHVSHGGIDILAVGLTSLDHISISELLGLGTLSSQLSGDSHLGSLGARLHNESEHTIASTTDGKSANKLVLE
jgi:hypothetical protein